MTVRRRVVLGSAALLALGMAGLVSCGDLVIPTTETPGTDISTGQPDTSGGGQDVTGAPDTPVTTGCEFGNDEGCDDGNSCTADECLSTGECAHTALSDVCKIGDECVANGTTSPNSVCLSCNPALSKTDWTVLTCDDGNDCTQDLCDVSTGCKFINDDSRACDDGQDCSEDDHCAGGACVASPCDCGGQNCADLNSPCVDSKCADNACVLTARAAGVICDPWTPCVIDAACTAWGNCLGTWDTDTCGCVTDADCNDGLACTLDSCNQATGACSNKAQAGSCFVLGACYAGGAGHPADACLVCDPSQDTEGWTPVDCDDGDDCTQDTCDPVDGCQSSGDILCCSTAADCGGVAASPCETIDCVGGVCALLGDNGANGASCDDGNPCTTGDACAAGVCVGTAKSCPASGACNFAFCDQGTGGCKELQVPEGWTCDDGDACTLGDVCADNGTCGGEAKDCAALADQCKVATCNADTGECDIADDADGASCDDADPCTSPDACVGGACEGQYDASIPGCGCANDADCDDGLSCTTNTCNEGACVAAVVDGSCFIGGACYGEGDPKPDNACLICAPGEASKAWSSQQCNDGTPCTDESCDPASGCVYTDNNNATCDDGDPCTEDDHCAGGACVGTCDCVQDADCDGTASACNRLACVDYACVEVPDEGQESASCDDGKFCTEGTTCTAGSCGGGTPIDCSALDDGVCIVGACDEANDTCVDAAAGDGSSCSDGDPCTEGDTCAGMVCGGAAMDCSGLTDQCNVGECQGGSCVAVAETGKSCTHPETCILAETCTADGLCEGSWDETNCGCASDATCSGLADVCNAGKCDTGANQCYKDPLVGNGCNDSNACTHSDGCNASGGCAGTPYTCDSGLSCVTSSCDGAGGCDEAILAGFCVIASSCYSNGEENPANPCQVCNSAQSTTAWSNASNTKSCNADSNGCTDGDTCNNGTCAAGAAVTCASDGKSCTDELCQSTGTASYTCNIAANGSGCFIGDSCHAAGAANPSNPCQQCTPGTSATTWSNKSNGTSCNADSNGCTQNDTCSSGVCTAGAAVSCSDAKSCTTDTCNSTGDNSYSCSNPINSGKCLIASTCRDSGVDNPSNACQECVPGTSQTSWSNKTNGTSCNADSNGCSQNDSCQNGTCSAGTTVTCSDGKSCTTDSCSSTGNNSYSCANAINATSCLISGTCYSSGDPNGQCQTCAPATSKTAWSNLSNGTSCNNDSDGCTADDSCSSGTCTKGTTVTCNDSKTCTADACQSTGNNSHTCSNTLTTGCLIGGTCYGAGVDNPSNQCQECVTATSTTAWTNKATNTSCNNDSNGCTQNDYCSSSGVCTKGATPACSDNLSCTSDSCVSTGVNSYSCSNPITSGNCLINGTCYADGASTSTDNCDYCNAATKPTASTYRPSGYTCALAGQCTNADTCNSTGSCIDGGNKPNGTSCNIKPSGTGTCFGGFCEPSLSCDYCCNTKLGICSADAFCSASPCAYGLCKPLYCDAILPR